MSPALHRHPHFVSLEGGEGAGKTTAINAIREALQARGHEVVRAGDWSLGRLSCVMRDPDTGILRAAANSRGAQGYAAGR